MPSKKPSSKVSTKNLKEKETPFDPVPYETRDVSTSISLLLSNEKEVVTRALWTLAKYAGTKDANTDFLHKNGVLTNLTELLNYTDLTILRFTLKIIGQIIWDVPAAAKEFALEGYSRHVKQINYIFMSTKDGHVTEFSAQILSRVIKDLSMASYILGSGVMGKIFEVLKTVQDADTQLNVLNFFYSILDVREAVEVVPLSAQFSARTVMCFAKSKLNEIREVALRILDKLTSWKNGPMQQLLRDQHIVEDLLKIILDPELKTFHKKAFDIIHTCMDCLETASYFVKSLEFVEFCLWAMTCPKKFILPSAYVLTSLTKFTELRQVLFDFSVEDTILSFFRVNNELVFYKTCEAIINMSSHRYCCEKMLTPIVMQCLLEMLQRKDVTIIPFYEIAIKTIHEFLKKIGRTLMLVLQCGGANVLTSCWLRNKEEYSEECFSDLMDMLYIFSTNDFFHNRAMNGMLYEMLLNVFNEDSIFSFRALLTLSHYIDDGECRQYFLDLQGPQIMLKRISSTPDEKMFKDILIFLQRIFLYKRVGMAFLKAGCLSILNLISEETKTAVPMVRQLIGMMYDLYLPIKLHELGRLDINDHFTGRFHLINGRCKEDFPFLEIMEEQRVCPMYLIYIVDYTADPDQLTSKTIKLSAPFDAKSLSIASDAGHRARRSISQTRKRSSILKRVSSTLKSQRVSIQHVDSFGDVKDGEEILLTCRVPPPVNFGYISEDPYLPRYVEKLRAMFSGNDKYILCFQHQVKLVAKYVADRLSGPDGVADPLDSHCLEVHLSALRHKLGTNLIPIGYLRCGSYCERALLFKALAEKVGVPCTLVRGRDYVHYWNEVPITSDEICINKEDTRKTYLSYAVVNLVDNVGSLMLVGSMEANRYCGLTR